MMKQKKRIIGLMSGTSLDGLDLCCIDFWKSNEDFEYQIIATSTRKHDAEILKLIEKAYQQGKEAVNDSDNAFGIFSAEATLSFIKEHQIEAVDFIASHGHTIFHQPENGITVQIGNGQIIADKTSIPVINDFRIGDVKLGGQGAPLVPIGDGLLFSKYDSCLNLGGIANISFEQKGQRIAFDIGPANIPLNHYIRKYNGEDYDESGKLAQSGNLIFSLYDSLNELAYHELPPPKSLGYEWMEQELFPICNQHSQVTADLLNTIVQYEAEQISAVLNKYQLKNVLITGGGAYNTFLIDEIRKRTICNLQVGTPQLIEFKEALVFGFLGYLRTLNQTNILASVTGAKSDSCGGIIHLPSN